MRLVEFVIDSQSDRSLVNYVVGLKLNRVEQIRSRAQRYGARRAESRNECRRCRIASDGASAQGRRTDARGLAGNGFDRVDAATQTITFIREEEECFVLLGRPANRASELVQPQLALLPDDVVEKVYSIKSVVPEIFKPGAVKLIAAGLCYHADLPAGTGAELRRIVIRIDAKLLHVLERRLESERRRYFAI